MRFPESSIENLRGVGYTEDEARFLYFVATHSGYFSHGSTSSTPKPRVAYKSMAFTQKLLGKGHANARLLLRNGRVYHLYSRLVYIARLAGKTCATVANIPLNTSAPNWLLWTSSSLISTIAISKPSPKRLPTSAKIWV
jgi:hypothetical protein